MKNKDFLTVSEKFTSIQGEGATMGVKSIFLRLSGCNLLCMSEHWTCDSIEVWRKGIKTDFEDVFTDEEVLKLQNNYHLIITGGEPLLYQKKVCEFLFWFKEKHNFMPILEFETNGTIVPEPYLRMNVKHWNVSPKLSSSGAGIKRLNTEALDIFNKLPQTIFKFVVSSDKDIEEINSTFSSLDWFKIWLMPAGSDRDELDLIRELVVDRCLKYNFNYSERLHIVIWNQKTGV